jgi:hypothetical protein
MQHLEPITVEDLTRAALRLAWGGKRAEIVATGINRALYLAARNHRECEPHVELMLSKPIVDRARELIAMKPVSNETSYEETKESNE